MDLMYNGLLLMLVGMGTVFAFLGIMVITTMLASKVAGRFAHLLPEPEKPAPKKRKPAASAGSDGDLIAVLAAAVSKYRADH